MNIVLLGKPGVGKGYISKYFERDFGFKHISTGDLCRKNIKEKTKIGQIVEQFCTSGKLVPLDLILKMLKQELKKSKGQSYIFDGFPRNVQQAQELENIARVDAVVLVDVPDDIILDRISKRRVCTVCNKVYTVDEVANEICPTCGENLQVRADDNVDIVKKRLLVFETETKPLIEYYKDKIVKIDNSGKLEDTLKQLDTHFKKVL